MSRPIGCSKLDQLDVSYGAEERALRFSGLGTSASVVAAAACRCLARQLDADRFAASDSKDASGSQPLRVVPGLRALIAGLPQSPIRRNRFSAEQIMLGGRPVVNLAAGFTSDTDSWSIERLDLRAPGATLVSLTGATAPAVRRALPARSVSTSDPDALAAWLQGRGEVTYRARSRCAARQCQRGRPRFCDPAMKAEIDGGAVEGRMALSNLPAGGGSRFDAELKGERLDLDAAAA